MNTATIKSMTGTGVAVGVTEFGELRVDLRCLNGRALQVKHRLCAEVAGLEVAFEDLLRQSIARGSVTLAIERAAGSVAPMERSQLKQFVAELDELASDLGLVVDLSLRDVLTLAANARAGQGARELQPALQRLVQQAIDDLQRHRAAGGAATVAAMVAELDAIERLREAAGRRAPGIVADYRDKLLARVRDFLAAQGLQLDPAAVVREVALFAERADVGEELQRLGAHVDEVRALLRGGGAIGRKVDFLLQEALREANTLGSKSPDVAMAHCVVDIKASIDRLKEQAANLE